MEATTDPPFPGAPPWTEVFVDPDQEYADFFAATWPRLFRTAVAITGDPGSAEDALQTAYAKVYASWDRVQRAEQPEAYVRRMVVNEVLGARRHGWWRRERPQEHVGSDGATPSPEQGVVDRDAVWAAVCALPVRQRAVIVLRYYEDLSEEQIAETLRCSRGTVKSQASAAMKNLRRMTGADLDGDPA